MKINANIVQHNIYITKKSSEIDDKGKLHNIQRELATEHKIQIIVNELPLYQVVCTPQDLEALVVGRLLTEGIIGREEEIESIYVCETGERAKVYLTKQLILENDKGQEVPSCCTDNKAFRLVKQDALEGLESISWNYTDIFMLAESMEREMPLYEATHAVHSCFLAKEGELLYECEDIGRHNALDKVIGYAFMNHIYLRQCVVFTSGRVPTDMVSKVIRAKVPVLISKGAPTADAVAMAEQYHLELVCNARKHGAVIYHGVNMKTNTDGNRLLK